MPGAGLSARLRALGSSRKCHSPRVPRFGGRGAGGGRPIPGCEPAQSALTAACSLTRASERPAPHEPLSLLVSGTSFLKNPSSLSSGNPHLRNPSPRFPLRKGSLGAGEWEGVAVPSPLFRPVTSEPQQRHVSPGRRER